MAHLKKKQWKTPELRRFETPEEVLEYYGPKASPAERGKLDELLRRMGEAKRTSAAARSRRNATG